MRTKLWSGLMMAVGLTLSAGLGSADTGFEPIKSRDAFVSLIADRPLTRIGIRLDVRPDGSIMGRALGRDVTGEWTWEAGYFCRVMRFGSQTIEHNCQSVARRDETLRFTSDRGAGEYADLRLR